MITRFSILSILVLGLATACAADGAKGAAGDDGMDGTNGVDGVDGVDGTNGTNGTDGTDGVDGMDGVDGLNGDAGVDGEDAAEVLVETELVFVDEYGCDQGYQIVTIGIDDGTGGGIANDGILQAGEIVSTIQTCLTPDLDDDGYDNLDDVCPEVFDPLQIDTDFDGVGDACDTEPLKTFYAVTRGTNTVPSDLYLYDPITNTATLIAATTHSFTNIKINPVDGELYGMTRNTDPAGCDDCLVQLNTTTGASTTIADLPAGPNSSIAFLSDGTLHTWTEDSDQFTVVDIAAETYTTLGASIGSWGHGMCSTAADEILWINGDGETYLINPSDGAATSLGTVETSAVANGTWGGSIYNEYGIRGGDCDPDSLFYIGTDLTYGGADSSIVTARLYTDAEPLHLNVIAAPVGNFHSIAMD